MRKLSEDHAKALDRSINLLMSHILGIEPAHLHLMVRKAISGPKFFRAFWRWYLRVLMDQCKIVIEVRSQDASPGGKTHHVFVRGHEYVEIGIRSPEYFIKGRQFGVYVEITDFARARIPALILNQIQEGII